MNKENHSFFFLSAVSGTRALLTKEEYRHACCVLRKDAGATVYGTDGKGNVYICNLTKEAERGGEVDIVESSPQSAPSPAVHVHIGLPDREAFEEALTGLSALGAAAVIPMVCRYCQDRWWQPWEIRIERLRRKMISGIKQARNPWLPDLHGPQPFADAVPAPRSGADDRFISIVADPDGISVEAALKGMDSIDRIDCFIGPPGGFSPDELDRLSSEGARFVSIARYRLRTELAAIVSCAEIMQHFIAPNVRGTQPAYLTSNKIVN